MCGRYTLSNTRGVQKRFNAKNKLPPFRPSYNITPSETVPAIIKKSPNQIVMMRWGFTWSKDSKHGTINIRKETTKEKSYFKRILLKQRCIIPSDGFYEWRTVNLEGKDERYPFFIYLKNHPLFGFAGLYNVLEDAEGYPHFSFAILTCPPNKVVGKVHHRMPAILEKKNEEKWLDNTNQDFDSLYTFIEAFPSNKMKLYPVSKRVNNPINDDKNLIKSLEKNK